jgi:acyl carrier protein
LEEVIAAIKSAFGGYLSIAPDTIKDDDQLYENLGIDSSGIVSLLLDLEQTCGVEFDMETLQPEHLSRVSSLAALIYALQSNENEGEAR